MHDEDLERPPGMPVWLKLLVLAVAVVLLVMVILMVAFGGEHGPGRHLG